MLEISNLDFSLCFAKSFNEFCDWLVLLLGTAYIVETFVFIVFKLFAGTLTKLLFDLWFMNQI